MVCKRSALLYASSGVHLESAGFRSPSFLSLSWCRHGLCHSPLTCRSRRSRQLLKVAATRSVASNPFCHHSRACVATDVQHHLQQTRRQREAADTLPALSAKMLPAFSSTPSQELQKSKRRRKQTRRDKPSSCCLPITRTVRRAEAHTPVSAMRTVGWPAPWGRPWHSGQIAACST